MNKWLFWIILSELIVVSWIDVKTKKISNWWFIFNLILTLFFSMVFSEMYEWSWKSILFPLGWLIGGFVFFLVGIMGAGDSKLLASLFLIIPSSLQLPMLEKLLYSTLVTGFIFLMIKVIKDYKLIKAYAISAYWMGVKKAIKSSFSFAPVVLIAWALLGTEKWK